MRAIPAALREKLLDRFKAEGLNNEPRLRLIAKQTTGHTLLSEPIHEDIPAGFGDVAFRQLEGEPEPSLAYAVCIDNGRITFYDRKLPSDLDSPWEERWRYGAGTDAAIEYNGTWQMDANKAWYYLLTEQYPYLFTVEGGELYVQHWTDASTRTHLASGVTNISACRGWQSTDDPTIDQGLIIGYLRGGKVYYRALCYEENGELFWETEREVTELGTNNTFLSVIRTNDFRVGFLTEVGNGADMRLVLTGRSYAGQSVRPETAVGWVVANSARITVAFLQYLKGYDTEPAAAFEVKDNGFYLGNFMAEQSCRPTGYERTSATTFTITFDHELVLRKPLETYITVTHFTGVANRAATVSVVGNRILVTTAAAMPGTETITVALLDNSNLQFRGVNTSPQPVASFSLYMEPTDFCQADKEYITATLHTPSLVPKAIDYPVTEQEERGALAYGVSVVSFVATQVGDVPI